MKKIVLLFIVAFLLCSSGIQAQRRYLDYVFPEVTVQQNVTYGTNISMLKKLLGTGPGEVIDLKMDVYQPTSDTATNRPLVIYLHTGSFLPVIQNGNATGSYRDSTAAEMCRQFAKRGYVAASISYRVGWNPFSSDQNVRTGTLLRAVYRAVQDARTAIRYFKKNADVGGNTFNIDTTRIVLCGQGSGGYVAFAAACLDKQSEAEVSKFLDNSTGTALPAADTNKIGNIWGFGGMNDTSDATGGNIPNHVGYSSDFHMMIEFGGALGDRSWIEPGDMPMAAAHVPGDPFAPYVNGIVTVPSFNYPVVEVSGPFEVLDSANRFGNNDVLDTQTYGDYASIRADQVNQGIKHLLPLYRPATGEAGPWDWWNQNDVPAPVNTSSLNSNPNMSKTQALRYIDTLQTFFAPRMVVALDLPFKDNVGVNEVDPSGAIDIYPNPASGFVNVSLKSNGYELQMVNVYDITGKLVSVVKADNTKSIRIYKNDLSRGVYFLNIRLADGNQVNSRVIFE